MNSIRAIAVFFLISVCTSTHAKVAIEKCEEIIVPKTRVSSVALDLRTYVQFQDREDIREIYNSSSPRKFEEALSVYLYARLKPFSQEIRDQLRSEIANLAIVFHKNDHEVAASDIAIHLPEELRESIIPLVVAAHEIEHVIQMYLHFGATHGQLPRGQRLRLKWSLYFEANTLYKMESGAMRAEWEILSLAGVELREHSISLVKKSGIPDKFKELFTRFLVSGHLTLNQYMEREHNNGRYSYRVIALPPTLRWMAIGSICVIAKFLYPLAF